MDIGLKDWVLLLLGALIGVIPSFWFVLNTDRILKWQARRNASKQQRLREREVAEARVTDAYLLNPDSFTHYMLKVVVQTTVIAAVAAVVQNAMTSVTQAAYTVGVYEPISQIPSLLGQLVGVVASFLIAVIAGSAIRQWNTVTRRATNPPGSSPSDPQPGDVSPG